MNYYDMLIEQMLEAQKYPIGTSMSMTVDGEKRDVPIDPLHLSQNDMRKTRMAASLGEDQRLRGLLGGKRSRRGFEKPGTYSESWYPGIGNTIMQMQSGMGHPWMAQSMARMDPDERERFKQSIRDWGDQQRRLMGMVPGLGRSYRFSENNNIFDTIGRGR